MSISAISGSGSLLSELSSASLSSSSSNSSRNEFQTAMSNLISAIQSGDLNSAQTYLQKVEQLAPSGSSSDSNNPVSKFLSSVESAISNNDVSSAQSALTTLKNSAPPPPPIGNSSSTDGSSSSSSGSLSELAQDVVSLFSAVSSGDVSSAQSAYDTLTSLLLGSSSSASDSSSSSSSTSSSSSSGSSFSDLLSEIGKALSSGNIDSAQSALNSFLQSLSSGSLVNTTA